MTNGKQESKGQSDLGEKCQDTVYEGPHPGVAVMLPAMAAEKEKGSLQTGGVEHSTTLKNGVWLNAMDGMQVDQGKSGMAHRLKGLAIMMQGEWVMAGQGQT